MAWLPIALLLAACSAASSADPSAAPPSAVPTPAPTPSPTPIPELMLVAEGEPALAERLRAWAAERGWGLRPVDPQGAAAALSDPQLDPQMVVSLGQALEFDSSAPAVLVDVAGAAAQQRTSTVGVPATHHGEAGFLAGIVAGLASQVQWVGQLTGTGAEGEAAMLEGFEQGLKLACARCRRVGLDLAVASVDGYRGQGVDVVFVPPSGEALPLASALGEAGVWLVWIGDLPAEIGPEALAGRVGFELEALLFRALDGLAAGEAGQAWPYTIQNGGLTLVDVNPEAITPGRQRLLTEHFQAVVSGELEIGLEQGQ